MILQKGQLHELDTSIENACQGLETSISDIDAEIKKLEKRMTTAKSKDDSELWLDRIDFLNGVATKRKQQAMDLLMASQPDGKSMSSREAFEFEIPTDFIKMHINNRRSVFRKKKKGFKIQVVRF